jgi:hypothetical protein
MKSTIQIAYTKHYDPVKGEYYVGWATDYTAVVVQAKSKKKLKKKILKSLKVLFLHFIDEIDKGNLKTELSEHIILIDSVPVAIQPCKTVHTYSKSLSEPKPRLCVNCGMPEVCKACNGEGGPHICGK